MHSYIKNNKYFCLGIATIICTVLSVCFSTVAHFVPFLLIGHYLFEILALAAYWNCFIECRRAEHSRLVKETALLNLGICLIGTGLFIRNIPILISQGQAEYLISELGVVLVALGIVVRDIFCREFYFRNFISELSKRLKEFVLSHKILIMISIILVIISILSGGNQPRWDAAYLFRYLDNCSIYSIFYLPQLSFISHINFSYSALNLIAEVLVGDLWLGMTILNISLFAISGLSMYGIIKMIVPKCSEWTYLLGTIVWLCSPFLLGMVNNNYWDYWMVCLLPILFYLILKEYWVLETVVAFVFCFVKETAVVAYAFICLGILIFEWVQLKGVSIKDKCRILSGRKKYWIMLLLGMVWLGIYIIMPNWSGNGGLAFDLTYIKSKLSVFFGMNFNWIFTIVGFAGIITIIVQRESTTSRMKWALPLLLGDLVFVAFSCLFVTVNHARYIDAHFPILFIFGIFGICMIQYERLRCIVLSALAILMLIQSFYTFDPVTKCLFTNYDVGTTTMISATDGEYLADSMVYNQQFQYFDRALNLALEEVVTDEDARIFFPAIHDKTWCFDGFAETTEIIKDYYVSKEYWDKKKNMRCILPGENRFSIDVYNVAEQGNWEDALEDKTGYYFYVELVGKEMAQNIKKKYNVLEETVWEYGGWIVHRIEFTR